jgi:hypothetical protein
MTRYEDTLRIAVRQDLVQCVNRDGSTVVALPQFPLMAERGIPHPCAQRQPDGPGTDLSTLNEYGYYKESG